MLFSKKQRNTQIYKFKVLCFVTPTWWFRLHLHIHLVSLTGPIEMRWIWPCTAQTLHESHDDDTRSMIQSWSGLLVHQVVYLTLLVSDLILTKDRRFGLDQAYIKHEPRVVLVSHLINRFDLDQVHSQAIFDYHILLVSDLTKIQKIWSGFKCQTHTCWLSESSHTIVSFCHAFCLRSILKFCSFVMTFHVVNSPNKVDSSS